MITINGEKKQDYDGVSLEEMLSQEGYQRERIAVEINGSIASKSQYSDILLHAGDVIEVVNFVGGG